MSLFSELAKVRAARTELALARLETNIPAAALLERGKRYPLTTVGVAAGAGLVLGTLNVHPLRVPGVGSLLSGGLAEVLSHGTQLIAELRASGLGSLKPAGNDPDTQAPVADADGPSPSTT